MTRFAFVVHPLKAKDAAKKYPIFKFFPDSVIESIGRKLKPSVVSHITGIESITGAKTEGWFIGCPLTPDMMTKKMPLEEVYEKIIGCTHLAKELGADLIGLGAFTSVVGDGGITVAKHSPIAVTSGNSYTVATAIEGTLKACSILGIDPTNATLAVVGATGSIGKTCAIILSKSFAKTIVVGRDKERTESVAQLVRNGVASVSVEDIREADVLITVTSAGAEIVKPEHLKPGAIVCDVARPRDVSVRVAKERPDVLVIEGGVVRIPGNVNFNFEFGFPPQTGYACMSETIMLALDGRAENFTLGKDVTVEQVEETRRLAIKHGFELDWFRSFEKAVPQEAFDRTRAAIKARIQKEGVVA